MLYFHEIILDNVEKVKDVLGKWGKKAAEATKKAEDLAGNMWQNRECSTSFNLRFWWCLTS